MTDQLGEDFTKQFNEAEATAYRHEGGHQWLKQAAKTIVTNLHDHVDKDREEEEGNLFPSGGSELEVASYVKKYITRAGDAMENLSLKAQADAKVAHGKRAAFETALQLVAKYHKINIGMLTRIAEFEEAKAKVLNGDADAGETPEEKDFLAKIREAVDPMEVAGAGTGGRQTRDEKKLVTLEMKRRSKEKKKAAKSKKTEASPAPTNGSA